MSECVGLDSNGALVDQGPVSSSSTGVNCAGYVLIDAASYGVVYPAVQAAYQVPSTTDAATWFCGFWGTVMFFYVVARCVGSAINMFNREK